MDQLVARIQALEASLEDRNRQVAEVAEAAGQAAAQAVNNQGGGHGHHQPAVDGLENPIDHRAEKRYDIACKSLASSPKFYEKETGEPLSHPTRHGIE